MKSAANPCHPRKRFATEAAARVASASIANNQGKHRLPEACSTCNGWHLAQPAGGQQR